MSGTASAESDNLSQRLDHLVGPLAYDSRECLREGGREGGREGVIKRGREGRLHIILPTLLL